MSARGIRFDRKFLVSELVRIIKELPESPAPSDAFGRFVVDLSVQVQSGRARHVKSTVFFERAEDVDGDPERS